MTAYCRLFLLCLLPLFMCHFVSAQYRFDSWTTDNGLPQNGVRSIAQTPDGYLWFTTLDGLVRFDGVKFTVFDKNNSKGIINNRFWSIFAAPNGDVWAATPDGELTIYHNGVFTSYPAEQIPESQITGFELDSNGEILINSGTNLYNLRNDEFTFARATAFEEVTKSSYFGKNNTLWQISQNETK